MPTLISLFSGAGGLDVGLEQAGFETVTATDFDDNCIRTLLVNQQTHVPIDGRPGRLHLDGASVVQADIADLSRSNLVPADEENDWTPDLLVGGPPCQPFSSSGRQRSVLEGRGRLFEHFVRLARELKPRAILFENVRGLVTARGRTGHPGEVLAEVKEAFEAAGYGTSFKLLNSADYGAPQRRVRLFMLAIRDAPIPRFPEPTHSRKQMENMFCETKPWVRLRELLANLPEPKSEDVVRPSDRLEPLLRNLPSGSGLKSNGRSEPTRPGGHWGYKQGTFVADQDLPARTVTAASTQDWIRLSDGSLRRLTVRECAALQGFPPEWRFIGTKTSQFRQVGNAVPAVFGRILGLVLTEALKEHRSRRPASTPFPDDFRAAVEYTKRDHERNAVARPRTNAVVQDALRANGLS
ncbi:MAG: DNA cytosine methyltransferase [Thermoanaerobaculales bacterium]|nr:DNA cytosine methyltransferase [Thermoanaerobaculales bacterium]